MQLNCIYIYCIYNINNFKFKFKRFEELSVEEFSVERWRLRFFSRFIMLNRMLRLYSLYRTSSTGRHQLLALSGHGTQTWGFANPQASLFPFVVIYFCFSMWSGLCCGLRCLYFSCVVLSWRLYWSIVFLLLLAQNVLPLLHWIASNLFLKLCFSEFVLSQTLCLSSCWCPSHVSTLGLLWSVHDACFSVSWIQQCVSLPSYFFFVVLLAFPLTSRLTNVLPKCKYWLTSLGIWWSIFQGVCMCVCVPLSQRVEGPVLVIGFPCLFGRGKSKPSKALVDGEAVILHSTLVEWKALETIWEQSI